MTVQDVINRLDETVPNLLPLGFKVECIAAVEFSTELLLNPPLDHEGELVCPREIPLDQELKIPFPWDGIYLYYTQMMACSLMGETARYNQTKALYDAVYSGYRDYYNRTRLPEKKNIRYL